VKNIVSGENGAGKLADKAVLIKEGKWRVSDCTGGKRDKNPLEEEKERRPTNGRGGSLIQRSREIHFEGRKKERGLWAGKPGGKDARGGSKLSPRVT